MPKLTTRFCDNVKPNPSKRIEIPDSVIVGLYLVVQVTGHRSWCVRYRHQSRPRKYTLGGYPIVTLATARELAREALEQVARGSDPAAAKTSRRGTATFEAVATRFIETYCRQHQKTWEETRRTLWREVVPLWRDREFSSIARTDLNELLHDILARGAPHTSNRVLAYLRKLWNWSIDESYVEHSPCDRVRKKAPAVKRDRVLNDAEIRLVWTAWEQQGWPWGHLQKLLLLTGARLREVAEMRWNELDLEAKLWVIPRERTKADREHSVPLSPLAIEIITSLPCFAGSPYLFPSTRARKLVPGASPAQVRAARPISGFSSGKREVDRLIAAANGDTPLPPWRWHDLRRTVRSSLSRLGINRDVAEAVLGHVPQGVAAAVYDRWTYATEKRAALEAWSALLRDILDPGRKVVALRR